MTCAYVHRLRTESRRSAWTPFQRRQRGYRTTEQPQPRSLTTPLSPWFNADSALSTLTGAREQAGSAHAWVIYRTQRLVCVLYTFFCVFLASCLLVSLVSCLLAGGLVLLSMLSANSVAIRVYVIYEVTRFLLISWMAPSVAWPTALTKQFIFGALWLLKWQTPVPDSQTVVYLYSNGQEVFTCIW